MKSLWNDEDARRCADDLDQRVYTSRLLGADDTLVMHGGGNTSVKSTTTDFYGDPIDVLYVKGSGWDLGTIERPGFTALDLAQTQRLATLDELTDLDMTAQLQRCKLDPSAPAPSVEAILHAILPAKFVDHTHTDAVVTLTNNPTAESIMATVYPDCLVLPYIMPGFILSKQVYDAIRGVDLATYSGIILLHHGVFTWAEDARTAYERMIELVTRAEEYIAREGSTNHPTAEEEVDLLGLARIRRAVSHARGGAQLAMLDDSPGAQGYASRDDVETIATRGPITPDHVIRTKRIPVIIDADPGDEVDAVTSYVESYQSYFEAHAHDGLTMLDPAPRAAIWKQRGSIAFGNSTKECGIITDIAAHTRWAIQTGETLGGWEALPAKDIFDLEYWSLEQAKLARAKGSVQVHRGKVALVTGANSGIGRAAAEELASDGATVVGLDRDPEIVTAFEAAGMLGIECDVTDDEALATAIETTVRRFGGLDILVCNAGVFQSGATIEQMDAEVWDRALAVNLTSVQRLLAHAIPFLRMGIDPTVLIVGSRNVPAPGPGAAAYSASKAGLTQLARVAALELASDGIRVNVVHPDAVFDTAIWTDEALQRSADRYGMTIEQYKTKNLLGAAITSRGVGGVLSMLASPLFGATTGAQVPIDGGSDRVI